MNHLNISEEQEKNLRILAAYLLSGELKAHFDMSTYTEAGAERNEDFFTDCGTVGCALGHGPYAGIPKRDSETWPDYGSRCFTGPFVPKRAYNKFTRDYHSMLYKWCFGGVWVDFDNTPEGAAKRILFILDPKNDLSICQLVCDSDAWCPTAIKKYNAIKL